MNVASRVGPLVLAVGLANCRTDSTGVSIQASLHDARDLPGFFDWSAPVNLGPPVNTSSGEFGSFISKDGLSLYFTCDGRCSGTVGDFDIFVSQRATPGGPWGPPIALGPNINTTFAENAPTITVDGHRMYFTSNRPGFGGNDIWVSRRRDKRDDFGWEPAENLGSVINTAAQDAGGMLFEDDATGAVTLYFTSNRPGGPGLQDLYASTRNPDGTFAPPTLIAELSTPAVDQQPMIRRDGLEIFVGSDRLGGMGLVDVWVATRASTTNPWSSPVNLGPVVNSTGPDGRPALSFKGTELYFQSVRPEGFGAFDLYVITRSKVKGQD